MAECQADMQAFIESGSGDPKSIYEEMEKLHYEMDRMLVPYDDPTGMDGFTEFQTAANLKCNGCFLEQCDDLCQRDWVLHRMEE